MPPFTSFNAHSYEKLLENCKNRHKSHFDYEFPPYNCFFFGKITPTISTWFWLAAYHLVRRHHCQCVFYIDNDEDGMPDDVG